MIKKPFMGTGYENPKGREQAHDIMLAQGALHRLPHIVQANEAWLASEDTAEIELQTGEGHRVRISLSGYAVQNLYELCDQLLRLRSAE